MKKNKRQAVSNEAPQAPQAAEKEQLFAVKLEVIGAEQVVVNGLTNQGVQNIRQWFAGLGHSVMELAIGNGLLVLDRTKVAYLVIGPQQEEAPKGE
jgi:hypothetical protein